tara:strand:- start:1312 stop:2340 length:1029 start_codon:yes stop_codon:yes gene_type:complete
MRKHKIYTHYVAEQHGNNSLFNVIGAMLRRISTDGNYSNEYANPIAFKNLKRNNKNQNWVSDGATSIVIIDDSRQEVSNVAKRGLITTSMIFNDILQCNKGAQNYEHERNRFFVQDNTVNHRYLTSVSTLGVLDVIWFMREQGYDALEISSEMPEKEAKILSERYNNIVRDFINDNYDEVYNTCKTTFDNYLKTVKSEPDNKGLALHDEDFETYHVSGWGDYHYSSVQDIGEAYFSILRTASKNDIEPITFKKHFQQTVDAMTVTTSTRYLMPLVGEKLGYIDGASQFEDVSERYFKIRHFGWKKIEDSKFKRNNDYHAGESNVIKAETLKLRYDLMEANNG